MSHNIRITAAAVFALMALDVMAASPVSAFPAGVAVGENILNNPGLVASQDGLPLNWNYNFESNKGRMKIVGEGDGREAEFMPGDGECKLWQSDIHLVPGAKYKLGAWVKTKALNASARGVVITPWSWPFSIGPEFPSDTGGEWKWVEKSFEAPKSRWESYSCGAYTVNHKSGSFSVRGLSLTALDEKGASGAVRSPKIGSYRRITPLTPRLEDIPAGESTFRFAYMTPDGKPRSCRVWTRMDGEEEKFHGELPVEDSRFSVRLSGMKAGTRGVLRAEALLDGKVECSVRYDIAVRKEIPLSRPPKKKLNNMVTRLVEEKISGGKTMFSAERDGWVFIVIDRAAKDVKVCLDDSPQPLLPTRMDCRFETMVRVNRGDHHLKITGGDGAMIVVNAIPGLYCYSMPGNFKYMAAYAPFRGEFFTNRIYSAFNMFGYGYGIGFTKDEWEDFHARGKERVTHGLVWNGNMPGFDNRYESAAHLADRLRKTKERAFTYDEVFISSFKPKWIYADAMRLLQDSESAPCTWSSGTHFPYTALDAEYYSACLNAAHGRGRFFFEIYPYFVTKDVTEAEKYLSDLLDTTCEKATRLVPDGLRGSYYVMGMYTGIGKSLCYDKTCDSDPKWYYSRYIEKMVKEPMFDGLCGYGIYAYANSEEEDVRWVCALVRHYLIKGRTDNFAAMHGIELDPKTVRNGNFRNGLEGWSVEGNVRSANVAEYAQKVQHRRIGAREGNEVAVFRRPEKGRSRLRQKMEGLLPGRTYALRYAVSPMKEIAKDAKAGAVRRYGLEAKVEGAEDVTADMPVVRYGGAERNTPKLNARTLVFKALSPSATLDFALDENVDEDEELVLSAVRVRPYFVD